MLRNLKKFFASCWKPFGFGGRFGKGEEQQEVDDEGREGLLRFRDVMRNGSCEMSMAVIQANQVLEDQCQIESGLFGTFVGVYDGHGGPDAARYVCDHLFGHFRAIAAESEGVIRKETIEQAFHRTEEGFTSIVSELWSTRPDIATVGSCCLVGVIYERTLFVANLGDSRVVLGSKVGARSKEVAAVQLSKEHNANIAEIRQELKELHPYDPHVVVMKHGVWRVKGIIQVSRSIGDVYMKLAEYNNDRLDPKFRLPDPINTPLLTAEPSITSYPLHQNDSFLIFASDGLWEQLTNEQAVEIVHRHPHKGSARRLVKAALQEAAKKRETRYSDLQKIDKKVRRHFHDDISVIVLFIRHDSITRSPPFSISTSLQHSFLN